MVLQQQSELVSAPLEAAFLPFYISQSLGWIYIRESIGDYRFYKDFKTDYLDYYSGISSGHHRVEKYNLEKEKKATLFEIKQLSDYKEEDQELKFTSEIQNRFEGKSKDFIDNFKELNNKLLKDETSYSTLCNKLASLKARKNVLSKTLRNIKVQKPIRDLCPTCNQNLPGGIQEIYSHFQDLNDAQKEKEVASDEIKKLTSRINSMESNLYLLRNEIEESHQSLRKTELGSVTYSSWINHNANLKLIQKIDNKKNALDKDLENLNEKIKSIGTDSDIEKDRIKKENRFFQIFKDKLNFLDAPIPQKDKYKNLYSITSFPCQGVELHETLLAYNFSFYEFVSENSACHKFPFILDAVFKEDIDPESRKKIFSFLSKESFKTDQMIFSVATFKNDKPPSTPLFDIEEIKREYFTEHTKLICIGDGKTKRTILSDPADEDDARILETLTLLELV